MSEDRIPNSPLEQQLDEPKLNEQEKAFRDLFVNEFMKDFDAYYACIRCGMIATFAADWSKRLIHDPYVQRKIADLTRKPSLDEESQKVADRALLENTLRQAMQHGPYAGRVAAARAFAEMRGWTKPDGSQAESALINLFRDIATKVPV